MSKLFFFDIDGTLIDCTKGQYGISQLSIDSIDQLKKEGHDVFLATGRCKCFILDEVMKYPFSGYVTCNGAYVEYKGKALFKKIVSEEAIRITHEFCVKYNLNYYFESTDYIYVRDKKEPRHIQFCKEWGMKEETIIDDYDPSCIEAYIGMIVLNSLDEVNIMRETLSPYFDIQGHQSPYSFDLTLKDVSKAVGIQELIKVLDKTMSDTIAFGDGRNDVEMLTTVGLGIAMGNGAREAKEVADYITDSVVNEGITTALKKYNYIK